MLDVFAPFLGILMAIFIFSSVARAAGCS